MRSSCSFGCNFFFACLFVRLQMHFCFSNCMKIALKISAKFFFQVLCLNAFIQFSKIFLNKLIFVPMKQYFCMYYIGIVFSITDLLRTENFKVDIESDKLLLTMQLH